MSTRDLSSDLPYPPAKWYFLQVSEHDNNIFDFSTTGKPLVRDLPAHVFIELGKFLNPKSSKNWVTLAGYLEFTTNEIKNFELEVNEATQNVLYQWGQKDSSTVDFLINVLKKMKRDDCVQVLKPWDN